MSILLTGGSGQVATLIANECKASDIPYLAASRRGQDGVSQGTKAIAFDWFDASTFEAAFAHGPIRAIFLVAPDGTSPADQMNPFIDLAVSKGTKRFVLVGGSLITKGGHWLGAVWGHLDSLNVEYSVLKPVWFLENFLNKTNVNTIKNEGKIYSACGNGKVALLTVDDIAPVAFKALTNPTPVGEELLLLGPKLLTFDDVAADFSAALGRKIVHVGLDMEARRQQLQQAGLPESGAGQYVFLESLTAQDKMAFNPSQRNDTETVLGRPAMALQEWLRKNGKSFAVRADPMPI